MAHQREHLAEQGITAAALEMPTHELAEPSQPGNSLYGLQTTDHDHYSYRKEQTDVSPFPSDCTFGFAPSNNIIEFYKLYNIILE